MNNVVGLAINASNLSTGCNKSRDSTDSRMTGLYTEYLLVTSTESGLRENI